MRLVVLLSVLWTEIESFLTIYTNKSIIPNHETQWSHYIKLFGNLALSYNDTQVMHSNCHIFNFYP